MPADPVKPAFLLLDASDKSEALALAADRTGRPAHLLEKDAWVVWTLDTLFQAPFGEHLVFKGGTSLSKAWKIIDRFSEDIDVTYDIRALIPDLAPGEDGIPPNRSQAAKWTKEVRTRLPEVVSGTVMPVLESALKKHGLDAKLELDGANLQIEFTPAASGSGYVKPVILVEFGARSTGEPATEVEITCDAAPSLPDLLFPAAKVRAMSAERTFWEKATAIHVFCCGGRNRGRPAFARHWFDLAQLQRAEIASQAIADRELAKAVARHKTYFFRETTADGNVIDYDQAIDGGLKLVPGKDRLEILRADYAAMIADGLLSGEVMSFENLLAMMSEIEGAANAGTKPTAS